MLRYTRPDTSRGYAALTKDGLVDELRGHNVEVPFEVDEARALIDMLKARRGALTPPQTRRDATCEALLLNPTADITELVGHETRHDTEANALLEAEDRARRAIARLLVQRADDVLAAVRTTLFEPGVRVLTAASKYAPSTSAVDLLRNGDHEGAAALAAVQTAEHQLHASFKFRRELFPRSDVNSMTCSTWVDPSTLDLEGHTPGVDRWLAGLRAGGDMWLGTFTEVEHASRAVDAAARAAEAAATAAAWSTAPTRPKRTQSDVVMVAIER